MGTPPTNCGAPCEAGQICNFTDCVCTSPMSKIGDFSLDPNQPCEINLLILRIMWSIQSALWIGYLLGSLGTVCLLMFRGQSVARKFRAEKWMLLLKSSTGVCFATIGVMKATDPEKYLIGLDPATTWIFCLGATAFWTDMLMFHIVQTNTSIITLAVAKSLKLVTYRRVYPLLIGMALVGTFSPLGMLYSDTHAGPTVVYAQLHFILLGVLLFLLVSTFTLGMDIVLKQIRFAITTHNTQDKNNSSEGNQPKTSDPNSSNNNSGTRVAHSGTSRDPHLKQKLEQIEVQLAGFRRDGVFHLISGPVSIAIGSSPLLLRFNCYYLPVIWTLASFAAIRYNAFSFRAIKSARSAPPNNTKPMSSDSGLDSPASADESSDRFPLQGLGIINFSKRKPKWNAKMSRITEQSENSRIVSMQEQTIGS